MGGILSITHLIRKLFNNNISNSSYGEPCCVACLAGCPRRYSFTTTLLIDILNHVNHTCKPFFVKN